jgi:hypothetical protein
MTLPPNVTKSISYQSTTAAASQMLQSVTKEKKKIHEKVGVEQI